MSFSELPRKRQEALFEALRAVYDGFEEHAQTLPPPRGSCAGCGRCCVGPPFYMTCSDVEFAYAMEYVKERALGTQVRFVEAAPDQRHAYRYFYCPFYSQAEGCTVHPNRPLSCRVFGRYTKERIPWDFCVFQDGATTFQSVDEVPYYEAYRAVLASYPAHRGYVMPSSVAYPQPTLELLLGLSLPWTPRAHVRIPV